MSRECMLTGKKPVFGHNVSHSQRKTRRRWEPNLHKRRIYVPELDRTVRVRVSARALRTIDRIGFMPFLRKQGLTIKDVTR